MFNNKKKIEDFNKKLDQALDAGDFALAKKECNDPELGALLDKGQQIKNSAPSFNKPNEEFQEKLYSQILQAKKGQKNMPEQQINQQPNQPKPKFNFWLSFKPYLVPTTVIIVLVALIGSMLYFLPGQFDKGFQKLLISPAYAQDNFELQPTDMDSLGVNSTSQFMIKSKVAVDLAKLKESIKIEPAVDFDLEKVNDQEFVLKPKKELEARANYKVTLTSYYVNEAGEEKVRIYEWAYEIKRQFKVMSTLPADQSSDVPINTGIEVTFSHENFSDKDMANYFTIEPKVEGRFEKHKRTVVFVSKGLAEATIYTITVKAGLPLDGSAETLAQDYVFSFETNDSKRVAYYDQPSFNFSSSLKTIKIQEPAIIDVYAYNLEKEQELTFNLYRFPTVDDFQKVILERERIPDWAYASRDRYKIDLTKLEKKSSFNAKILDDQRYGNFIQLPEGLAQGFYLLETTFKDRNSQLLLQVTNMGAYLSNSQSKILVWLNDIDSQKPLVGANISVINADKTISAQSNDKGVALIDNFIPTTVGGAMPLADTKMANSVINQYQSMVFKMETATDSSFATLSYWGYSNEADKYWTYFYSDRPVYLATDSVRFWGMIKNREGQKAENVNAQLVNYSYYNYFTGENDILQRQDLTVSDRGTFEGEFSFANLQPGSYQLVIKVGDARIIQKYIEVRDYVKPAYKIEVTADKQAVFSGDKVSFKIKTQFFEGTPVPDLKINFAGQEYVTNAEGEINVVLPLVDESPYNNYQYFEARPVLSEEAGISAAAYVQVFGRDVTLKTWSEQKDLVATIKGRVNKVDLDKINNNTASDFDGLAIANQAVTSAVTEITYLKLDDGEEYDYINKVVNKKYKYERQEKVILEKALSTDANGEFNYTFNYEKDKSYSIKNVTKDYKGREVEASDYVWGGYVPFDYHSPFEFYRIDDLKEDQAYYKVGDKVTLYMVKDESIVPSDEKSSFLFLQARNGIKDYSVTDKAMYEFDFTAEDIPNIYVQGVWFDGRTYKQTYISDWGSSDENVLFDYREKELTIKVTKDKEKYQPGEEVKLNVEVTDKNNKPVQSEVNFNLVDEAYYRLFYEDRPNPLSSIYRSLEPGIFASYTSHKMAEGYAGAERGGGAGVRTDFRDRAYFAAVTTDSKGKAEVKFKLPDNITSWRVTSQAIGADLYAGADQSYLPVSLPFFISTVWNDQYLLKDKPVVSVRAYGTDVKSNEDVTYKVNIPSLGVKDMVVKGKTFQPTDITLPELKEGTHDITVEGEYKSYKDGIKKPIEVIVSRLVKDDSKYYDLQEGLQIQGNPSGLTRLVFMDNNQGKYYYKLWSLNWTGGDRADQQLTRVLAAELLKQYFGEDMDIAPFKGSNYQKEDGGIAILPYSSSDLAMSARLAGLAGSHFDVSNLKRYFFDILSNKDSNPEEISLALYGLASLDEPVMTEINLMLARTDLTPQERLYLALAASESGAGELARSIYKSLMAEFGEKLDPYIRMKIGKDQDDYLKYSLWTALLAADLDAQEKDSLWSYAAANWPKEEVLSLEEVDFVKRQIKFLNPGTVSFKYSLNDKTETVNLEKGESYTLNFWSEDLSKIKFSEIKGKVGLVSFFQSALDPQSIKTDPAVKVSRKFFVGGKETTNLKDGDIVEVRLYPKVDKNAADNSYVVTDSLPSGMQMTDNYVTNWDYCSYYYPDQVDRQTVKYYLWRDWIGWDRGADCKDKDYISYYTRVISKGEYQAEESLIQGITSLGSINVGNRETITIK